VRYRYLLKRLGLTLFSLWAVATILFLLFRLAPGSPASMVTLQTMSPELKEEILRQYGLDKPLPVQYYRYILNLFTGELGRSFAYNEPVGQLLLEKVMNTIVLTLTAVVLAFFFGPIIGAYLAWHRGEPIDTYSVGVILAMYAAPIFWTGMLMIMVFSFKLGWFPAGGMHSLGFTADSLAEKYLSMDFLRHLVLPLTVTTLYWISAPTFVMRNNMLDVLGSGFIKMNRAQGLPELSILYKHAARNALLPVMHYAALALGFAIGGAVVTETVFSWPGVGRIMWSAVLQQDYPLAQGAFFMLALLIITLNFLVDVLSVFLDPRVEETEA
jgi:peptide/nickel transport system permease protein